MLRCPVSGAVPTRRALLGSALLAPIAAASCLAPAGAAVSASKLPAWIAALVAAEKARDHYQEAVYDPAYAAWKAAAEALPHHTTAASFTNFNGDVTRFTTDSSSNVATARSMCRTRPVWLSFAENADYRATCEEVVDAADRREEEATALQDRFGIPARWDELDRLCDAAGDALEAVAHFHSLTIHDVDLKLAALEERGGLDETSWMLAVRADVRRLAGEARS